MTPKQGKRAATRGTPQPVHLDTRARTRLGAFYTPQPVAKAICEAALAFLAGPLPRTVIDPACGAGAFLGAYLEVLREHARRRGGCEGGGTKDCVHAGEGEVKLFGLDVDPRALELASVALELQGLVPEPEAFHCCDALLEPWPRARFDLIIGNPPFRNIVRLSCARRAALKARFATYRNKCDLYGLFLEASLAHLAPGGVLAMICADSFLGAASFAPLREQLLASDTHRLRALWTLGPGVFDAAVRPLVLFVEQVAPQAGDQVLRAHLDRDGRLASEGSMPLVSLRGRASRSAAIPTSFAALARAEAMEAAGVPLETLADFSLGVKTGDDARFVLEQGECARPPPDEARWVPCLRGRDVQRFAIGGGRLLDYRPAILRKVHGARPRAPEAFARASKVLVRETAGARLVAAMDTKRRVPLDTLHALWPKDPARCSAWYLLGVLASAPVAWWYAQHHPGAHVKLGELRSLPVPSPEGGALFWGTGPLTRPSPRRGEGFREQVEGLARFLSAASSKPGEPGAPAAQELEAAQAKLDGLVARALGLEGWPP